MEKKERKKGVFLFLIHILKQHSSVITKISLIPNKIIFSKLNIIIMICFNQE